MPRPPSKILKSHCLKVFAILDKILLVGLVLTDIAMPDAIANLE